MICEKCKKRETAYVSPGKWCEFCWSKWWYEEMIPENETAREEMIGEASKKFKDLTEITNLRGEDQPAAIRNLAERVIQPVVLISLPVGRLRDIAKLPEDEREEEIRKLVEEAKKLAGSS